MSWVETSPAVASAIDIAMFKSSLRVTHNVEDTLIQLYVKMATDIIELKTGRALVNRGVRLQLPSFPASGESIRIPLYPLFSVGSIESDGETWDDENYILDKTSLRPLVSPRPGVSYPSSVGPVTVNFTAGYGVSYSSVPSGLQYIVFALATHFYLNRTPVMTGGGSAVEVPKTLDYAILAYKIWEA